MNTPSCDPSWMHPKQVAAAARCGLLESTVGSFADQPSALLPINRRRRTPAMNPGTCRVLRASGAHTAHDALDALPPRTTRLTRSRFNTACLCYLTILAACIGPPRKKEAFCPIVIHPEVWITLEARGRVRKSILLETRNKQRSHDGKQEPPSLT
jgi:hypothetical protein